VTIPVKLLEVCVQQLIEAENDIRGRTQMSPSTVTRRPLDALYRVVVKLRLKLGAGQLPARTPRAVCPRPG